MATRFGPRRSVIGGLLLLGLSSLVFGFARDIALLDAARFVQGVAGALIWSGALTWLITTAPDEQRGSVIGTALGTRGRRRPARPGARRDRGRSRHRTRLRLGARRHPRARLRRLPPARGPGARGRRACARSPRRSSAARCSTATAFVAVPSLMFGAIEVLVPLRIAALGGGHVVIAAGFIAGAALEAGLAPIAGRYSDRVGRRTPVHGRADDLRGGDGRDRASRETLGGRPRPG